MQIIGSSFQAALFAYDEGILSNDRVLASALWRHLFSKDCDDPERLECVVNFVRRQVSVSHTMHYLNFISYQKVMKFLSIMLYLQVSTYWYIIFI